MGSFNISNLTINTNIVDTVSEPLNDNNNDVLYTPRKRNSTLMLQQEQRDEYVYSTPTCSFIGSGDDASRDDNEIDTTRSSFKRRKTGATTTTHFSLTSPPPLLPKTSWAKEQDTRMKDECVSEISFDEDNMPSLSFPSLLELPSLSSTSLIASPSSHCISPSLLPTTILKPRPTTNNNHSYYSTAFQTEFKLEGRRLFDEDVMMSNNQQRGQEQQKEEPPQLIMEEEEDMMMKHNFLYPKSASSSHRHEHFINDQSLKIDISLPNTLMFPELGTPSTPAA